MEKAAVRYFLRPPAGVLGVQCDAVYHMLYTLIAAQEHTDTQRRYLAAADVKVHVVDMRVVGQT